MCRHARQSYPVPLALCVAVLSGCSSDHLPTYPVKGRVVFSDGSPVHLGTVEFKSREHSVQARGDIGNDGTFQLSTYEDGDGAVAGNHDCVVVQLVIAEELGNFEPSQEGVVHPRYGSYSTSGLQFEVQPNTANDLTVHVEGLAANSKRGESPATEPHAHSHDHDHAPGHEHKGATK